MEKIFIQLVKNGKFFIDFLKKVWKPLRRPTRGDPYYNQSLGDIHSPLPHEEITAGDVVQDLCYVATNEIFNRYKIFEIS